MSKPSVSRLEAYSDAVIAIIATLLILEIKVPKLGNTTLVGVLSSLEPIAPKFISFAVSFITISIYWVNHHVAFHLIKTVSNKLLWMNTLFLFWICVIPFTTAFAGDYINVPAVIALYSLNTSLLGLSFYLLWIQIHNHHTKENGVTNITRKKKLLLSPVYS